MNIEQIFRTIKKLNYEAILSHTLGIEGFFGHNLVKILAVKSTKESKNCSTNMEQGVGTTAIDPELKREQPENQDPHRELKKLPGER
jgi:hypothetical protein